MKKFAIQIQETYIQTIEVEAANEEEAIEDAIDQGIDLDQAEYLEGSTEYRATYKI